MKKLALTLLTCLSFNSLSARCGDVYCEKQEIKNYIFLKIDESKKICKHIESILPEDHVMSKGWNYNQGKIDALQDLIYLIEFNYFPSY